MSFGDAVEIKEVGATEQPKSENQFCATRGDTGVQTEHFDLAGDDADTDDEPSATASPSK